ncbi:unnamed protein product [Caenorhabditis auriculariae]|uniref:Uncharacterized protein n=1 Tax=Caenorhabditis auriculariae TaxID=2777116 RepID=A0A8S1GMP7_9PELO|nr:unnamed protein product [Caenorhabditis auriculariae]
MREREEEKEGGGQIRWQMIYEEPKMERPDGGRHETNSNFFAALHVPTNPCSFPIINNSFSLEYQPVPTQKDEKKKKSLTKSREFSTEGTAANSATDIIHRRAPPSRPRVEIPHRNQPLCQFLKAPGSTFLESQTGKRGMSGAEWVVVLPVNVGHIDHLWRICAGPVGRRVQVFTVLSSPLGISKLREALRTLSEAHVFWEPTAPSVSDSRLSARWPSYTD